ncbi:hypothetical protein D3C80_1989620 [compost metagenome]
MGIAETVMKVIVEGGVLVEPLVRSCLLPEIHNFGGKCGCIARHGVSLINNAAAG